MSRRWIRVCKDDPPERVNEMIKQYLHDRYSAHFPYDCDDIRTRIAQHLQETKQTCKSFLQQLGNINSNTYNRFMSRKGAKEGESLNIYPAAVKFFKKKDNKDDEGNSSFSSPSSPSSVAVSSSSSSLSSSASSSPLSSSSSSLSSFFSPGSPPSTSTKVSKSRSKPKSRSSSSNRAEVEELKDEMDALAEDDLETDDCGFLVLPTSPSCNTIRKKINQFLATSGWTQTGFLSYISVNSNSFQRFMKYTGPMQGIDNQTYRAAAEFFFKLKLVEDKKKGSKKKRTSKKRKTREEVGDHKQKRAKKTNEEEEEGEEKDEEETEDEEDKIEEQQEKEGQSNKQF